MKFIWIAFSLSTGYSIEKCWLTFDSADGFDTLTMAKQKYEMNLGPYWFPGVDSSELTLTSRIW